MLSEFIKNKTNVVVFIINGFCMEGVITHESDEAIILMTCGGRNVIYKHAISTIRPA